MTIGAAPGGAPPIRKMAIYCMQAFWVGISYLRELFNMLYHLLYSVYILLSEEV